MRTDPLLKFETIFGFKLNCPSNARHGLILESKTNNSSHLCDITLGCGHRARPFLAPAFWSAVVLYRFLPPDGPPK